MITISPGKGFFDVVKGHDSIQVRFPLESPLNFIFQTNPWKNLPPVSETYDLLVKTGASGEKIIEGLMKIYHLYRYFRVKHLSRLPLVIVFVGGRGSGKSVGAVKVAVIDYLLCGYRVWSNLNIAVRVTYKNAEKIYRSEDLDKANLLSLDGTYKHGLVFIDEANVALSESRRSMSNFNLNFNYAIQQIRKRDLSLIMTLQNEEWLDSRIRWQMDFGIKCEDSYFTHSYGAQCVGDKSKWKVYDLSGISGQPRDINWVVNTLGVWNRPFWEAYNTFETQSHDDLKDYNAQQKLSEISKRATYARDVADEIFNLGFARINTNELWEKLEVSERESQVAIGAELYKRGVVKRRGTDDKYFYEFPEIAAKPS
jgi:hypothetical protein